MCVCQRAFVCLCVSVRCICVSVYELYVFLIYVCFVFAICSHVCAWLVCERAFMHLYVCIRARVFVREFSE